MMLNPFPTMFLSLFAHAFLRIVLGAILVHLGFRHLTKDRASLEAAVYQRWPRFARFAVLYMGVVEIAIGAMFVVGIYTQIAAIVAMALSTKMLVFRKYFVHSALPQSFFYMLMFAVSCSLFITGAGVLAFDLPL